MFDDVNPWKVKKKKIILGSNISGINEAKVAFIPISKCNNFFKYWQKKREMNIWEIIMQVFLLILIPNRRNATFKDKVKERLYKIFSSSVYIYIQWSYENSID